MFPRVLVLVALLTTGCGTKSALTVDPPMDSSIDSTLPDTAVDTLRDTAIDVPPDTRPPCISDEECDDGLFCNGREFCDMGSCASEPFLECIPPPDGCTMGVCDEALRDCVFLPTDVDGNRHFPLTCGGDDCDDEDPTVFGGAPELCDYQDNDCDAQVDERLPYAGLGATRDVSVGVNQPIRPDIVFDGDDYDIVYDSETGLGQVVHTAVNRNGRPGRSPSDVTFSTVLASSGDLTFDGSAYGLWHHYHLDEAFQGTVSFTRLRATGTVSMRAVAATADVPDADVPAAAWNGSAWGVAYVTSDGMGTFEIRYLEASAMGDVTVAPLTLASSRAIPFVKPGVVWTGDRFVVSWGDGGRVFLDGRNRRGTATAWRSQRSAEDQSDTALAWTGRELMLAFTSTLSVDTVHLARYTAGGTALGREVVLTPDAAQQNAVDAVWTGRELGVTYQRSRTADPGTYVVRVGEGAAWISPPGLVDSREAPLPGSAIAATNREYGVAYASETPRLGAIFFRRVGCE